ncbi:MAG: hypothetical protein HOW73_16840 [Polyangiaceae bacterium]|nr:hypothetical protein [Polyangiaceae bacterium]
MSYLVRRWWGKEERDLDKDKFREVIEELEQADDEHPDVALKHETEWVLSYSRSRRLVFENVEHGGGARHLANVDPERVVLLWGHLADGDLEAIDHENWEQGY